jgi:hypothetical protein
MRAKASGDGSAYREYGPRDEAATEKGIDAGMMKMETLFQAGRRWRELP